MIPLDEAQRFVLGQLAPLPPRPLPIAAALGCVVSEDVAATEPVPPFANSSMDGYAVRAQDTADAPVSLQAIGSVMAGHVFDGTVGPGQAVRIMTGAPLPSGADAVCMIEETETDSQTAASPCSVVSNPATSSASPDATWRWATWWPRRARSSPPPTWAC